MKINTIIIVLVVAAVSFAAGYMTSEKRNSRTPAASEAARKDAEDFRNAEKAVDDKLTIPDLRRRKNE